MTNHELALQLTARGWSVFPAHEAPQEWQGRTLPKKSPYIGGWPENATRDQATITSWWRRWPGALVGIACEKSGIFVLDVDLDEEKEIDGYKTYTALALANGANEQVICGPLQNTPRGGTHLIFKAPDGLVIRSNAGVLGEGLDLRGAGGYITTGPEYHSPKGHELTSAALTEAPVWLIGKIRKKEQRPATTPKKFYTGPDMATGDFWLAKALDQAPNKGRRNSTGFWLACELRDNGLTIDQAERYMIAYAQAIGAGDYSKVEALESLKSAYKRAPRQKAEAR